MSGTVTQITNPAILQQQVLNLSKQVGDLEIELERERQAHAATREENDCLLRRIRGFEAMSESLATHVDKICKDFYAGTGGRFPRLVK